MAVVKFYGLTRLEIGKSQDIFEAKNINELLKCISWKYKKIKIEDLRNSVIFVNGSNITTLKMFKTRLKPSDIVLFLSPISGG